MTFDPGTISQIVSTALMTGGVIWALMQASFKQEIKKESDAIMKRVGEIYQRKDVAAEREKHTGESLATIRDDVKHIREMLEGM